MSKGLGLSVKVQREELGRRGLDVGCEAESVRDRLGVGVRVWRPLRHRLPLAAWPRRNEHPIALTGVIPRKVCEWEPRHAERDALFADCVASSLPSSLL